MKAARELNDVCRELGIHKSTFYNWRKKYAGIDSQEGDKSRVYTAGKTYAKWLHQTIQQNVPRKYFGRLLICVDLLICIDQLPPDITTLVAMISKKLFIDFASSLVPDALPLRLFHQDKSQVRFRENFARSPSTVILK